MPSFKLTRKQALGIKIEVAQGTPVVPSTSTDYFLVENVDLKLGKETLERDYKRTTLDSVASVTGKRWAEVTFITELKNGGTGGTAYAPMDAALRSCGLSASFSASAGIVYQPTSTPSSSAYFGPGLSATLEGYRDGHKWIIAGAVGTVQIEAVAGQYPKATFTYKGQYTAVSEATNPTPTFASTNPPVVESATFILSGSSPITSKLTFDLGNDVQMIDDVGSSNAVYGFFIAGRKPVGSCDPIADTITNRDDFAKLIANTEMTCSAVIGSTAGNRVTITAPQAQYTDISYADTNGLMRYNIPLRFNGNENSLQIKLH